MPFSEGFMFTDCGERATLLWLLNYHFPKILRSLAGVSDDFLFRQPTEDLNPPGWIFAHMAVKERDHIAGFAQGINDVPAKYTIFRGGPLPLENEMRAAADNVSELTDFFRRVREQTSEYLSSITDSDLKNVPRHVSDDPIREFFVMTIQHQYYHWAQLEYIRKLLMP